MKITGLTVHLFEPRTDHTQEVAAYRRRKHRQNGLAILHTDEGVDGVVSSDAARLSHLVRLWPAAAENMVGQSVFDRGRLEEMLRRRYIWPDDIIGLVDYALWDITGKAFSLPIYKLLGGYKESVKGYASTIHHGTDEAFVETALQCKADGFKAIKIHPYCAADDDIRICHKIRTAVGDDMVLMLDSLVYPAPYTRQEAFRVLRALEELNFHWFEDPLHKSDVVGLAELRKRATKVQIRAADRTSDIRDYRAMVELGSVDIIAGPPSFGITDLMRLAAYADLNGLGMEPHDFGGGTASLHVLLSITNGHYYEIAVPRGAMDAAPYPGIYLDAGWIDSDGNVPAPKKAGLGFEIDLKEAKRITAETKTF